MYTRSRADAYRNLGSVLKSLGRNRERRIVSLTPLNSLSHHNAIIALADLQTPERLN